MAQKKTQTKAQKKAHGTEPRRDEAVKIIIIMYFKIYQTFLDRDPRPY